MVARAIDGPPSRRGEAGRDRGARPRGPLPGPSCHARRPRRHPALRDDDSRRLDARRGGNPPRRDRFGQAARGPGSSLSATIGTRSSGASTPSRSLPTCRAAAEAMSAVHGDLALAQDGDADRLGVLDASGGFVSPHRILALLLLHAFRRRGLSGGIARTFSTSLLIDRVAAALGAPLHETAIGFKYIAELMNRGEAVAGGEESGGYAFALHLPERDGVFNALLLIESLALAGRDLEARSSDLAWSSALSPTAGATSTFPSPSSASILEDVRREPPRDVAGERGDGSPRPGRRQVLLRRPGLAPAPPLRHGADDPPLLRARGRLSGREESSMRQSLA